MKIFERKTVQESQRLEKEYKEKNLAKKIEVFGSMYGHSAAEVSPRLAELRADPWIFKANNLFKDGQLDEQYRIF
jgi:hypothetical protein